MEARELAINHTLTPPAPQQLKCAFNPALAVPVLGAFVAEQKPCLDGPVGGMKQSNVCCVTQGISMPASPFVGKVLLIPAQ